jgi:PPM family protein phosphatase
MPMKLPRHGGAAKPTRYVEVKDAAVRIAARSAVGVRERNEDDLRHGVADGMAWAVLSDGAGGHADGAVASDLVVRLVTARLQAARNVDAATLHAAVHEAHELLLQRRHDMHATLVALWIDTGRGQALWTHVGDSRLYLLRAGRVAHVTRDDSVVRQLLDAGLIDAHAAATHPLKHQLLCALGAAGEFEAHTLEQPFALADGDALLLCSDGWWEALDAGAIEQTLAAASAPEQWLAGMQARIDHAALPRQDNHSAIALWV